MQVNGTSALRISTRAIREAVATSESLSQTLLRYVQAVTTQSAQTAATNARLDIPRRLARWLLMCHDRVLGDNIYLTHEMISIMLGVRRPGVTFAMTKLEEMRAVKVHRGRTEILDRTALAQFVGNGYGISEREHRRLIGPFGKSSETRGKVESC